MNIRELFKAAYEGSYYTIMGCGGNLFDWKKGYQEMFDEREMGKIKQWFSFTGKDMNEEFGLTGENRYDDSLKCLMFPLDGLDIGKLAMFKLKAGDRWFDDIVDNNARREANGLPDWLS